MRRQRLLTAAASASLLIGALYFFSTNKKVQDNPIVMNQNLQRVLNKVSIYRIDGTVLDLTNAQVGVVYSKQGLQIVKIDSNIISYEILDNRARSSQGMDSIAVPNGSIYQIILSDGTKARIDPGSSIAFKPAFDSHERMVQLYGGAFFEVAKKAQQPFRVMGSQRLVEALGTDFSISAYPGQSQVTTLLAGRIALTCKDTSCPQKMELEPGDQVISNGSDDQKTHISIREEMALRNNLLYFEQTPIKEALTKLSRYYNTKVDSTKMKDYKVSGVISFKQPLATILAKLNKEYNMQLVVRNDTIKVK